MLDGKSIKMIEEILKKGGSVEIRRRKNEIIVVEVRGKIKYTISVDAQEGKSDGAAL